MRRAHGPPHGLKEKEGLLAVLLLVALLVLLLVLTLVLVMILVALVLVVLTILHRRYLLSLHWVQAYSCRGHGKIFAEKKKK